MCANQFHTTWFLGPSSKAEMRNNGDKAADLDHSEQQIYCGGGLKARILEREGTSIANLRALQFTVTHTKSSQSSSEPSCHSIKQIYISKYMDFTASLFKTHFNKPN
jgi:hypothetical protein